MFRICTLMLISCSLLTAARSDEGLLGDDDAATVAGDVIEARGDLAEGLGKGALLRSLSAKQLQQAIDQGLSNRKERVEMYYQLQDLREEELEEDRLSASQLRQATASKVPNRLNDNQLNEKTGEIYWPSPLDSDALKPYRKPIEDSFEKRGHASKDYNQWDYLKVHRMVKRIREAIDSIADQMDAREVVALKNYLDQIDYEARFNLNDERIDY